MNRAVLVGRLVRDPDLRYTASGIAVANFTVAVDRRFKKEGEQQADFIPVIVWQKQAENAAKYLAKGSQVGIDGRIQTSNYEDKDGKKVYKTEIVAENVQYLGNPKGKQQMDEIREEMGAQEVPKWEQDEVPF